MKKKYFLFALLAGLLVFSCKRPPETNLLVQEDITYFQNVFENGYVFYDEIYKKKPFEFNSKKLFKDYKKHEKFNKSGNHENGINQDALTFTLGDFMLNLNPEDNHLCIQTKDKTWIISMTSCVYSSEFCFEKRDESFFLTESPDPNLLGKKYTGNADDLKKTVIDNKETYIYAPSFFDYNREKWILSLDGKKMKIHIKMVDSFFDDSCLIQSEETDDSLYVRCGTFDINENSEEEYLFLSELEKISKKADSKKFIILDLRKNNGGYVYYPMRLVASIYGVWGNKFVRYKLQEFLAQTNYGVIRLDSEILAKERYYAAIKENKESDIIESAKKNYEDLKGKEKKLVKDKNMCPIVLPQWENNTLDAKIIVLTDCYTSSSAEICINFLYMMDKNNVILVGQNTSGTVAGGNAVGYELPNSKLKIWLSSVSHRNTLLFKRIPQWKGENYGFYPDYWHIQDSIADILVYLTGDNQLKNVIN